MFLKGQSLRDLVVERMVVAADEIFALFERTFAEYEAEVLRQKLLQQRHKEDGGGPQQQPPIQEQQPPEGLLFAPVPVKTEHEDAAGSCFLEQEESTGQSECAMGQSECATGQSECATGQSEGAAETQEPGRKLQSDNDERVFSCSDSDDSDGWVHLGKGASTSDGQGEKDVSDFVDEDIPALYKSLFCPESSDKKAQKDDSDLPKPFKCTVCGKAFETDELFEKHVFVHGVQSPFLCPVCNKLCSNKSSFKKHLNIHTEERPFRCTICKKGFNQKCNLKRHMQTHNEERSFSCPECGLRLKQQHNLLRHISAVHRGERPYSCPVCDKAFAQKTVYIIHMRTHTGEKPFTCNICKKRFRDKCHLKRHIKTHGEQATAHGGQAAHGEQAAQERTLGPVSSDFDTGSVTNVTAQSSSLFSPEPTSREHAMD